MLVQLIEGVAANMISPIDYQASLAAGSQSLGTNGSCKSGTYN